MSITGICSTPTSYVAKRTIKKIHPVNPTTHTVDIYNSLLYCTNMKRLTKGSQSSWSHLTYKHKPELIRWRPRRLLLTETLLCVSRAKFFLLFSFRCFQNCHFNSFLPWEAVWKSLGKKTRNFFFFPPVFEPFDCSHSARCSTNCSARRPGETTPCPWFHVLPWAV